MASPPKDCKYFGPYKTFYKHKPFLTMTTKDFSDFKISLNLNLEVDVNMRKITELVKIISAHSRACPEHLTLVNNLLTGTIYELSSYIDANIVNDGTEN